MYETKIKGRWLLLCYLETSEFSSILQCVAKEKINRRYKSNSVLSKLVRGQGNLVKVWSSNLNHAERIKFKESIVILKVLLLNRRLRRLRRLWCIFLSFYVLMFSMRLLMLGHVSSTRPIMVNSGHTPSSSFPT